MSHFEAARAYIGHHLWAMEPAALRSMVDAISAGGDLADHYACGWAGAGQREPVAVTTSAEGGKVAHLFLQGIIAAGVPDWLAEMFGIVDPLAVRDLVNDIAATHEIAQIHMHIDSPGGTVKGTQELADALADSGKPITATVMGQMASAAYWIGSTAGHIEATPQSTVGSIGVYSVLYDTSKLFEDSGIKVHLVSSGGVKGGGEDGVPISAEVLAEMQRRVDDINAAFVRAVADNRGLAVKAVKKLNTGQVWQAEDALGLGLIDNVNPNPQGVPTPQAKAKGPKMNDEYLSLAEEFPAHIPTIKEMAAEDASVEDIRAVIEAAQAEEALAEERRLAAETAEALAVEKQAHEACQASLEEAGNRIIELEAEIAELKSLGDAPDDPGATDQPDAHDDSDLSEMTIEERRQYHLAQYRAEHPE